MNDSLIPWPDFMEAYEEEDNETRETWFKRWTFADDGVRTSIESASQVSW